MDSAEVDQACEADDDEASNDVRKVMNTDVDTREADKNGEREAEESGGTACDHDDGGRRGQEERVVGRKAVVGRAVDEGLEAAGDEGPRVLNKAVSDEGQDEGDAANHQSSDEKLSNAVPMKGQEVESFEEDDSDEQVCGDEADKGLHDLVAYLSEEMKTAP